LTLKAQVDITYLDYKSIFEIYNSS